MKPISNMSDMVSTNKILQSYLNKSNCLQKHSISHGEYDHLDI